MGIVKNNMGEPLRSYARISNHLGGQIGTTITKLLTSSGTAAITMLEKSFELLILTYFPRKVDKTLPLNSNLSQTETVENKCLLRFC